LKIKLSYFAYFQDYKIIKKVARGRGQPWGSYQPGGVDYEQFATRAKG
jgi:hypothetical protein